MRLRSNTRTSGNRTILTPVLELVADDEVLTTANQPAAASAGDAEPTAQDDNDGSSRSDGEVAEADPVPQILAQLRHASGENQDQERVVDMAAECDRSLVISVQSLGKVFPAPDSYDGIDIGDDAELYGQAPWFDRDALSNNSLILVERYAEDGWLPGGLPYAATGTWCWRNQFACRDVDLIVGHNRTLRGVRGGFARMAMNGFNRLSTWIAPAAELQSTMFLYRTFTEREYLTRIAAIPVATIEAWRNMTGVDRTAYVWPKPLLLAEFRYLRKDSLYWTNWVRNERRLRSKHGRVVPRQCLATFGLRESFFARAFPAVTPYWLRVEVPRGCGAETPWVFSYYARELIDPSSGFWRIAYTEFAACVGAYILFEAYDNYRLWALSPDMIRDIRVLDLVRVVGSQRNADELLRLLTVIESTDFASLNPAWTTRGRITSYSPGRRGPGADWLYYNPWARRVAGGAEVRAYVSSGDRAIPEGHPRGWDHETVPDGWGHNPVESGNGALAGGWDGDVPHDDMNVGSDGDGDGVLSGVVPPAAVNAANAESASAAEGDLDVVRRFFRDVGGVPDRILEDGTWASLVGYTQGRFA